jgi:hypothetical protein
VHEVGVDALLRTYRDSLTNTPLKGDLHDEDAGGRKPPPRVKERDRIVYARPDGDDGDKPKPTPRSNAPLPKVYRLDSNLIGGMTSEDFLLAARDTNEKLIQLVEVVSPQANTIISEILGQLETYHEWFAPLQDALTNITGIEDDKLRDATRHDDDDDEDDQTSADSSGDRPSKREVPAFCDRQMDRLMSRLKPLAEWRRPPDYAHLLQGFTVIKQRCREHFLAKGEPADWTYHTRRTKYSDVTGDQYAEGEAPPRGDDTDA